MSGHSPWKGKPPSLSGEEPFRRLSGAAALIGLSVAACLGWAPYAGMRRESCPGRDRERLTRFFKWTLGLLADRAALRCTREDIGVHQLVSRTCLRLFSCAALEDVVLLCGKLILAEIERPDNPVSRSGTTDVVRLLTTAAMMSAMLAKIDSTVRFFTQADRLTDHLVSRHPIKCLNGVETSPLDVLPQRTVAEDVFRLAKDESAQGDGLIFQYGDVGCSVLFCGDSRFGFFKGRNSLILDRPTVVTAPSQGHCAANPAYRRISSNAPEADVWVRSHLPYARKVSEYYKDMPRKYCLANCVDLTVQEILLRFEYGRWRRSVNTVCACS